MELSEHPHYNTRRDKKQVNRQRQIREQMGLTAGQLAEKLRDDFPKMSKAAVSLAERPAQSGVEYTNAAKARIDALNGKKQPNRKKPCRITARLTKGKYKALNSAMHTMGHATMQEAIGHAVELYLDEAREKGLNS